MCAKQKSLYYSFIKLTLLWENGTSFTSTSNKPERLKGINKSMSAANLWAQSRLHGQ